MPDLPTMPHQFPKLVLWIQYPSGDQMARARYVVVFKSTACRISFKDKSLENMPDSRHIKRDYIIVNPYVSKQEFITFVKEYISEKASCHLSAVTLRWEKWLPFWGEPWQ